jgi:ABC-2 type transport system ATP-binding protein
MTGIDAAYAIEAVALRKSYGEHVVLDGIDLRVRAGTVFSLLGPNGAGKTTAVQIFSTLITFDGGEVRVAGHDVVKEADAVRAAISVTGQFAALDDILTGEENLLLMGDLNHLGRVESRRRAATLLERFELTDAAHRTLATYSGGMRRRLDLAMTLMSDPRIIFLDEPTTGLDPRSRLAMWDIIRGQVADGVTIFLTTQYLDEADELANEVAVLDSGRIVARGTPAELKGRLHGGHLLLRFDSVADLDLASAAVPGSERDDQALTLTVPGDGSIGGLRDVLDRLDRQSVEVASLSVHTPDLDDVFFSLTGRPVGATADKEIAS